MVDRDGNVLVTDDHKTFQYLDSGKDATYISVENLDLKAAQAACEKLGVELKPATPDNYPSIECFLKPEEPLSSVIGRVSEAIDRVFSLARRPDLK